MDEVIHTTLTEHKTFRERTHHFAFDPSSSRHREAHTLAVVLDHMMAGDHFNALEVAIRRYQALLTREEDGNWDLASVIESLEATAGRARTPPQAMKYAMVMRRLKLVGRKATGARGPPSG